MRTGIEKELADKYHARMYRAIEAIYYWHFRRSLSAKRSGSMEAYPDDAQKKFRDLMDEVWEKAAGHDDIAFPAGWEIRNSLVKRIVDEFSKRNSNGVTLRFFGDCYEWLLEALVSIHKRAIEDVETVRAMSFRETFGVSKEAS